MKVAKENVNYLVFEGGGGKGITYIGAVHALEELGILSYIKEEVNGKKVNRLDYNKIRGVAGTSVGSIATLLVACGYTPEEMEKIITTKFGENILDSVTFGKMPTIYTPENPKTIIDNPNIEKNQLLLDAYMKQYIESEKKSMSDLLKIPAKAFTQMNFKFLATLFKWYLYYEARKVEKKDVKKHDFLSTVPELVHNKTTKLALDKILANPAESINSLKYEYGLFIADYFRKAVDSFIEEKSGIKNCTFKQFFETFKIDIVITGYDATTNELLYFRNNERWKNLCVADAVRMSISIPFLFKPVMIMRNRLNAATRNTLSLPSYIVDGGLANNFPIHVFDDPGSNELNPNVLGFTLGYNMPFEQGDTTFFGFVENLFLALLKQTTLLQFKKEEEKEQVIELDTDYIKVLDFSLDEPPIEIIRKAKEETLKYFS
ncbi:MAG: patatin-like phospholipase family protein [Candidatus Heimdallarchaeaceae archaeon]